MRPAVMKKLPTPALDDQFQSRINFRLFVSRLLIKLQDTKSFLRSTYIHTHYVSLHAKMNKEQISKICLNRACSLFHHAP
jgi:hypothetical protein